MRLVLSQRARTVCMRRSDMLGMPTGGFDMAGLHLRHRAMVAASACG